MKSADDDGVGSCTDVHVTVPSALMEAMAVPGAHDPTTRAWTTAVSTFNGAAPPPDNPVPATGTVSSSTAQVTVPSAAMLAMEYPAAHVPDTRR